MYNTDAMLDRPDNVLLVQATSEVQRAFPELRGHLVFGAVRQNERTQTLFRVPTADSLHVQTPWNGILACGDWIGYPSPAMWIERSCITGIAAANSVLQTYALQPYPIIAPRRPEPLAQSVGAFVKAARWLAGPLIIGGARLLRRLIRVIL